MEAQLIWKPLRSTLRKISKDNFDQKKAFKHFRYSSSGYISKPIVRNYIMEKFNSTCVLCGSLEHPQIDHILSVYYCHQNNLHGYCNSIENLQVLCRSCNASKLP